MIPYRSANVGKSECVNIRDEMGTLLASDDAENSRYSANNIRRSADGRADDIFELSARAYDLGLRDDAVFWFYNAKNRAILLREIINLSHAQAK